jgi:hypothetical protein
MMTVSVACIPLCEDVLQVGIFQELGERNVAQKTAKLLATCGEHTHTRETELVAWRFYIPDSQDMTSQIDRNTRKVIETNQRFVALNPDIHQGTSYSYSVR